MLFDSIDFAIFLPIVFLLYWYVFNRNIKLQNLLIVAVSYLFYGWWDWRFLSLIFFSTIVDYAVGLSLEKTQNLTKRKVLLWISILMNLGFLGFFKYYNFFLDNFMATFSFFGQEFRASSLSIILPVGISFYTFQTLSYTIDIYRKKLKPTKDFIGFAAFVSFFPQLVAGPIERATNLLPQFSKKRQFNYSLAVDGLRQILWGLFNKVVIANNCAKYVDIIFASPEDYSGSTLLLGATLFAFQIYGDFSGYSNIAIGTARLFGFDLMRNFAYPYFSRDIAEFWRRWHISLSTWFRDYLYIPLGGSRGSIYLVIRNVFIIFLVSGFWHGANWTFIVWGLLNAIFFLPILLTKKNRANLDVVAKDAALPNPKEVLQMLCTFFLTTLAWIFFRAESVVEAFSYLEGVFSLSLFSIPEILPFATLCFIAIFLTIEWLQRHKAHAFAFDSLPSFARWGAYIMTSVLVISFFGTESPFIYFQF